MERARHVFIYNLFPALVGPIADWHGHLARIAGMGFSWIYLNPFHYPGFSGSLYAVKDYKRLNPLFQGESSDSPDAQLAKFNDAAHGHGLKVMMDLVVNHTARDSVLVDEHPDWFARAEDGSLRSPGAVDPNDPTLVTEWGDLAEIDYGNPRTKAALIDYWRTLAIDYSRLGFDGFRCDAAYQVPADVWAAIISGVRAVKPDALFAAETLGCRPEQIDALLGAGFDWLFNSAKWWDFRSPWLFEQYEATRRIAPSIAFPESHDTERLGAELPEGEGIEAHYRLRATFAAFFSAGWMMPVGYEYGFRRRLDVVETRPEDWEEARFDLSEFLAELNRMKGGTPALVQEGPQHRIDPPDSPVIALLRLSDDTDDCALGLINPHPRQSYEVDLEALLASTGLSLGSLEDVTPQSPGPVRRRMSLGPLEMRVLRGFVSQGEASLVGEADSAVTEAEAPAIVIENVAPELDGGRYPVKREVGDVLEVTADIFKHGHDRLAARVLFREAGGSDWHDAPMTHQDNDRWAGRVPLPRNMRVLYTVEAWTDVFESWRDEVIKKREVGQDVALEVAEGRALVESGLLRLDAGEALRVRRLLADFDAAETPDDRADVLQSTALRQIMARHPDRSTAARYGKDLVVVVDRPQARFAAWYEMMARSQGTVQGRSATFRDCEKRLPEIARMGFDVIYLLPFHPIGRVHRKGPDNSLNAAPDDPGSPYAIGGVEGGHTAIHPDLGTLDDFRRFVQAAAALGLEVAMDFAIQCAPDHPWVREHPEWFVFRPDGTIRYAENPPKKYQDIVNINFSSPAAPAIWAEMLRVVQFWVEQGVTAFRVDNPHTKPVPFWEWLIAEVQAAHPEIIFLSEAFTRPKMMHQLAKVGFTQSYTYFTWRNFKAELTDYLTELSQGPGREYFRPHFFPTTPDILPVFLQTGGRPAFRIRLVLAATLSSLYGIYNGYELCENAALPGKEEYLHSEKYQFKVWDWNRPGNIKADIAALNAIRRANPALQEFENLRFHPADDDNILFYGKMTLDRANMVFVAVNLDPFDAHEAVLHFPLREMGVPPGETFEVEELLGGGRHLWRGEAHSVRLDPRVDPAAIFRVTVWTSVDYRSPCL